MRPWLLFSLSAALLWGIWGVLGKVAARTILGGKPTLFPTVGWLVMLPIDLRAFREHVTVGADGSSVALAVGSGLVACLGGLFFALASTWADSSRVVPLTAIYPLVTLLLGWIFLGEGLSASQVIGAALIVAGGVLLAL